MRSPAGQQLKKPSGGRGSTTSQGILFKKEIKFDFFFPSVFERKKMNV
jgi:hypothetical protein